MSSWEVRGEEAFEGFPGNSGRDGELAGHLLLMLSDSGRVEDHFRVALTGKRELVHTFMLSELGNFPGLDRFELTYQKAPSDLLFKANSFTTKWENVEDLVATEKLGASTDEVEDADDAFRAAWASAKASERPPAAALRWSLQAHEAYGFAVVLQGLPVTARALRKDARLTLDAGRTVELASWVAVSPMLEGSLVGPKPLLFAPEAAEAAVNLGLHPERLEKGKPYK